MRGLQLADRRVGFHVAGVGAGSQDETHIPAPFAVTLGGPAREQRGHGVVEHHRARRIGHTARLEGLSQIRADQPAFHFGGLDFFGQINYPAVAVGKDFGGIRETKADFLPAVCQRLDQRGQSVEELLPAHTMAARAGHGPPGEVFDKGGAVSAERHQGGAQVGASGIQGNGALLRRYARIHPDVGGHHRQRRRFALQTQAHLLQHVIHRGCQLYGVGVHVGVVEKALHGVFIQVHAATVCAAACGSTSRFAPGGAGAGSRHGAGRFMGLCLLRAMFLRGWLFTGLALTAPQ